MFRRGNRSDLEAIEELHRKDRVAAKHGDVEALLSLWTEDAVAMPTNRPTVRGKKAIREMIERDLAELGGFEVVEYVLDFDEVEIFGDHAVECGIYRGTCRSKEDGTTIQGSGRLLRVLERQ